MSDVLGQIDVESIEHLDFEVTCNWTGCDQAASSSTTCRGCGDFGVICARHLARIRRESAAGRALICAACPRRGSLEFVVDVRPLP